MSPVNYPGGNDNRTNHTGPFYEAHLREERERRAAKAALALPEIVVGPEVEPATIDSLSVGTAPETLVPPVVE